MPQLRIDSEVQKTLAKLASALAKAFSAGADGDTRWTVSGVASRAWKISHPDLPVVQDDQGIEKDILLQLHIRPPDDDNDAWLVVAQNKVVGPETHASPQALIVAREEEAPSDNWDTEGIAEAAANFFRQQKRELVEEASAVTPALNYPQPVVPGVPAASRRARIARRILKADLEDSHKEYCQEKGLSEEECKADWESFKEDYEEWLVQTE